MPLGISRFTPQPPPATRQRHVTTSRHYYAERLPYYAAACRTVTPRMTGVSHFCRAARHGHCQVTSGYTGVAGFTLMASYEPRFDVITAGLMPAAATPRGHVTGRRRLFQRRSYVISRNNRRIPASRQIASPNEYATKVYRCRYASHADVTAAIE